MGQKKARFADLRRGGCLLVPFRLRASLLFGVVEARDSARRQGRRAADSHGLGRRLAGGRDGQWQRRRESPSAAALRGSTTLSRGAGASIGPVRHCLYGLCRGYWMKDEGVLNFFCEIGGCRGPCWPPGSAVDDDLDSTMSSLCLW